MSKAEVMLLGEAWGENEAKIERAFVGETGKELLLMLHDARFIQLTSADFRAISAYYRQGKNPLHIDSIWNAHPELFRTNVFNLRPQGNRIEAICRTKSFGIPGYPALAPGKYASYDLAHHLTRLYDEIVSLDPNLIICLGNTALWSLAGLTGISKLRGSTRYSTLGPIGYKLLPTYHPSAVVRQWELRWIVVSDFVKAKREVKYPEVRRPHREVWIEPTLEDMELFYERHIRTARLVSVDIETSGRNITCIGFAPRSDLAIVVPFADPRAKNRNYWTSDGDERRAWNWVAKVCGDKSIKKVLQNGTYDISFLWRTMRIPVFGAEHDTMLLQHALMPEALKSLGFLGSIHTDEGSWKEMRKKVRTIKQDD